MDLGWLANKRVLVVGMGLTGQSCVTFLQKHDVDVCAADSRELLALKLDVPIQLGEFDIDYLCQFDVLIVSPGININEDVFVQAKQAGCELIGDIELFARLNTRPVIAITGSNGKSTVTSLVGEILNQSGKKAVIGGNFGTPVLTLLEDVWDVIVLELSSFQLETTQSLCPVSATVLNVTPDHLDRYAGFSDYHQAKLTIYKNAQNLVMNSDDELTQIASPLPIQYFSVTETTKGFGWDGQAITLNGDTWLYTHECLLTGLHNILNFQAAALVQPFDLPVDAVKQTIKTFTGLPHRCEVVSKYRDVTWINDSKATNVGATVAAIEGLKNSLKGRLILIAGGDAKSADLSPLSQVLQDDVSLVITLGKDGNKIAALAKNSMEVDSLSSAIKEANSYAQSGDVVLLSPACASLDMFANYQERGKLFVKAVSGLAHDF